MKNKLLFALGLLAVAAALGQSNDTGNRRASDRKIGTTPAPDYTARVVICPACNPEVRLVSEKTFPVLVRHVLSSGKQINVDEDFAARADLQGVLLEIDGFQFYWYRDYLLDKNAKIKYTDTKGNLELIYRFVTLRPRDSVDEWERMYSHLQSLNGMITDDLKVDMSSLKQSIKDELGIK